MDHNLARKYMNSWNFAKNETLSRYYEQIIDFKNEHFIPAVSLDTALFLKWFVNFTKPQKLLEIGFGAGASSLFMIYGLSDEVQLTSLERDGNRYKRGLDLLSAFNVNNIKLIKVDAFDFLNESNETFDLIFLDAQKRDYINYLPLLKKSLNSRGAIITDNLLFGGKVYETNIEKKYISGIESLKTFNRALMEDSQLDTFIFDIGDGLSVSYSE